MSNNKGNGTYEFPYQKPEERTRWEQIRLAIYNPSTNEVLGRTAASWGGLIVFYSIFYFTLGVFFTICMKGMLYTIDDNEPYWTNEYSLIGSSPGLGFRPISENVEAEGALIWYQASNETNRKVWTDRIDKFLHLYHNPGELPDNGARNQVICDYDRPPPEGKVCAVTPQNWPNCTRSNEYGYRNSSPCVYIKLNRIYDWVPEYYNDTSDLPDEMPADLKEYIAKNVTRLERNTVWVSCEGENPADRENIGKVTMIPYHGIPGYYFPYKNQKGYLSPLVAIFFERPKTNIVINIECRAWAKNINYRRHSTLREGSVHFEIMVD